MYFKGMVFGHFMLVWKLDTWCVNVIQWVCFKSIVSLYLFTWLLNVQIAQFFHIGDKIWGKCFSPKCMIFIAVRCSHGPTCMSNFEFQIYGSTTVRVHSQWAPAISFCDVANKWVPFISMALFTWSNAKQERKKSWTQMLTQCFFLFAFFFLENRSTRPVTVKGPQWWFQDIFGRERGHFSPCNRF